MYVVWNVWKFLVWLGKFCLDGFNCEGGGVFCGVLFIVFLYVFKIVKGCCIGSVKLFNCECCFCVDVVIVVF